MNIPFETLIGWAGTMIVIGISYGVLSFRTNQNDDNIKDLWKWKDSHQKDVSETREKFQNQISELKGASLVTQEQFRQIMAMFEEIKERLLTLENQKHG